MRHISIKWRMTIWFSLLMIVITALMLVFVMLMNRNQVTRPPAAEVVRMVQRNADDVEYDHGAYDFSDVEFFGHGVYTEIFDADGRLVAGSAAPAVTEVLPLTAGPIRTAQGSDGAYYVYDLPLAMNGGALWVRGTISANAKGSVMEVIVPLAWSVLPALVLLSVAGGWLISSLSFKPMEKVIAAAASISGGEDLSRRIGLPRGRSEINRLAGAFDDMFDRLERSFHAEAQFTSDASHELRTPVAVILTECDTLEQGQPTVKDYRAGVEVIHGQARQMSRLITQLLHITRLEQGTQKLEKECADLSELAQSVCTAQAQLAPRGITLTCGSWCGRSPASTAARRRYPAPPAQAAPSPYACPWRKARMTPPPCPRPTRASPSPPRGHRPRNRGHHHRVGGAVRAGDALLIFSGPEAPGSPRRTPPTGTDWPRCHTG